MNDGCSEKTIGGGIHNIPAFFFGVIPFGVAVLFFVFIAISLADDVKDVDLLEEALSAIAAGKKDLGIRKDLNSNGRMDRFDRWIEGPLTAPGETRDDARRLFQAASNPVLWLKEMGSLGEIKNVLPLPNGNTFHLNMTNGLAEEMRLCVETLLAAMAAANRKLGELLQPLDESQHSRLMTYLFESALFAPKNDETEDLPVGREVKELIDDAARVDRKALLEAGLAVIKAIQDVKIRLAAHMEKGRPIKTQTLTTALGRVEIGGPGPDEHNAEAVLVIDVGGNDVYRGNTAFGRNGACSIVLDLNGDDIYLGENGAQGSGIRGIGILWDVTGNDFYRAGNFAQGAGLFGMGLLVDEGGRDHYSGGAFVQAASAWGFGGLLDLGGEDLYECRNSGQAFAGVKGTAVLCDLFGNDKYLSGAATPDHRDTTMNQSLSQGFAIGMRDMAGGGYALLADQWGNDHYECQYFGQGAGYYMGLGVLYDQDGKDTYAARRYAQGAGIHYAFGMLMDEAGDDRYLSWGVSQGCGHDYGIGFLVDGEGNDSYVADWLSMGASNANGTGIFIDNAGNDRYGSQTDMPVGELASGRRSGGIGVFVDAGGKDIYSRDGADNTIWGKNRFAVGIDENEGRTSGVGILKAEEKPPVNPEVELQRKAEAERLSSLLADGEDLLCAEDMLRLLMVASSRGLEKKIPELAKKRLFEMDPKQSIPLMVDVLDMVDVLGLFFLERFFPQQGSYAVPALMAERKDYNLAFEIRRCYYLGVIKDTRALPVCLEKISDSSWKVRSAAVRAIGDMLDRGRLENLIPMKKAFKAAVEEKSSKPIGVYLEADKERCAMLLSVVVRALPLPTGSYNRYFKACKENPEEIATQSFVAFVYENSSRILPVMDTWIADIQGSGDVAERLMPLLSDSDSEVRRAAAYSLGQIRYSPAIPLLLNLLDDPELWVRDGAVLSLALFKGDAVGPLCKRMKQEGPGFRILALDALGRIDTPQARSQMEPYLNDTNPHVRRAAKRGAD